MQFITLFSHAGHKHLESGASDKGSDALVIAGIATVFVGVFVISVMVYDAKRRSKKSNQ